MTNEPPPSDSSGADVCGMPQRKDSSGRDRLEEIASEYLTRIRAGETLDLTTFAGQYPSPLAQELKEFLPLVAAMEDWKVQREIKTAQTPLPEQFEITHLGEFRVIREIARGGMGVVFEAEQPTLSRHVAVKLLPWKFPKNSTWSNQFLREARIAARLQHAHIVPVYSFGEQDNRYFYVMQLIKGIGLDKLIERWNTNDGVVSLKDLIREFHPQNAAAHSDKSSARLLRRDSWQQVGRIATQIVSAIRYAHKHNTLHRDIKPGNILIDEQGKIWVTDFGLAMAQEKFLKETVEPLAGTLRYMAPEQFLHQGDARSDLYAFGATLYELCTLRPAFAATTKLQLLKDIETGKLATPRSINRDIPLPLEKIILKCLALSREQRYQTADQLYADLLRFVQQRPDRPKPNWWRRLMGET